MRALFLASAVSLGLAIMPAEGAPFSMGLGLGRELVTEGAGAFSPGPFSVDDFALEWVGEPIADVTLQIVPGSLEWVRVGELVVLPRALIRIHAKGATGGSTVSAGFTLPMQVVAKPAPFATAEFPLALLSGEWSAVRLDIRRAGKTEKAIFQVRFKPKTPGLSQVYLDPSCSSFGAIAQPRGLKPDQWAYVGCRQVFLERGDGRTANLEMFVYWDGVGSSVEINGTPTTSTTPSLFSIRLNPARNSARRNVTLKTAESQIAIAVTVGERPHFGHLGIGLGPYTYTYQAPGLDVSTIIPLVTLYASYSFNDTNRLVAFDATSLHKTFYSDLGIYYNNESARLFDRRLSLNVMLGAHVLWFKTSSGTPLSFGVPQGFELVFRDAFKRSRNLSAGAFIYPAINDKAYYNIWLRWGSSALFYEINYILWKETLDSNKVMSRSVGVSLGFPLLHFL